MPKKKKGSKCRIIVTNSKTAIGVTKVPMNLFPPSARIWGALAMLEGKEKYGLYNFRDSDVSMMMYLDAIERHEAAMLDGEDKAPDSDVYHAAHIMACCAIIVDAYEHGNLLDDRPSMGEASQILERERKLVQRIIAKYKKGE